MRPINLFSSSTTRMRFFLSEMISVWPKRLRKSITGMIFPRRLITPSTVSGALGTAVISGTRTISRTEPMRTPNVSLPMRKPTTWRSFSIAAFRFLLTRSGVFHFFLAMRIPLATRFRGITARSGRLWYMLLQNKAIHAVQEVAGKLQHLLGGRRKLGRTRGGLLHEFAHLVHRTHDGLRSGSLFLDGGINFLRNFGEATSGLGNLRRTHRLLVGRRANLLREFVDFGHHIGNLVQRGAEVVT